MIKYTIFVCLFCCISMSWADELPDVIGKAYSLDNNQVLYEERHFYSKDGITHQVFYMSAKGDQFAHKILDYKSGKSTPMFRQEDSRISEVIEVKWVGSEQLAISYFAKKDGPKREKLVDVKAPLVIDAGFDQFIRDNWNVLLQGDRVKFHFPAPSRMTLVGLAIESRQCSYATDVDNCFFINASNWLFKMLVDPIEVGYDKNSQQLKRFRGLANIQGKDGKGLKVDIHYHYPKQCNQQGMDDCGETETAGDEPDGRYEPAENDVAAIRPLAFYGQNTAAPVEQTPARYVW